jgi:hypothetical protein
MVLNHQNAKGQTANNAKTAIKRKLHKGKGGIVDENNII